MCVSARVRRVLVRWNTPALRLSGLRWSNEWGAELSQAPSAAFALFLSPPCLLLLLLLVPPSWPRSAIQCPRAIRPRPSCVCVVRHSVYTACHSLCTSLLASRQSPQPPNSGSSASFYIRCSHVAQWLRIVFIKVFKVDSGLYQAVEHAQRLERSQAMYVINLGESAILNIPPSPPPYYWNQTEPVLGR